MGRALLCQGTDLEWEMGGVRGHERGRVGEKRAGRGRDNAAEGHVQAFVTASAPVPTRIARVTYKPLE